MASHYTWIHVQISHHDCQGPCWPALLASVWATLPSVSLFQARRPFWSPSMPVLFPASRTWPWPCPCLHVLSRGLNLLDPSTIHAPPGTVVIFSRAVLLTTALSETVLSPSCNTTLSSRLFIFPRTLHLHGKYLVNFCLMLSYLFLIAV